MAEYIVRTPTDKNDVRAVLGDALSSTFVPHLKLSRWDGEVEFSVAHDLTGMVGGKTFSQNGDTYLYDNARLALKFYPKTDAYEFELILKLKPATNTISLPITTKGLAYYYQPPLTEEYRVGDAMPGGKVGSVTETEVRDEAGNLLASRPEDVVGSYAVYHESKRNDYSLRGGMNYRSGKAFHIYRPKLTDALGAEAWATLQINTQTGRLIITAPQAFLDSATYPVIVDPTFGFTGMGGTTGNVPSANTILAQKYALSETGTATSISAYISHGWGAGYYAQYGIYDDSDPRVRKAYTGSVAAPAAVGWTTANIASADSMSAGSYWLCLNTDEGYLVTRFDSGAGQNAETLSQTFNTWDSSEDAPWTDFGYAIKLSIYCTYTVESVLEINVSDIVYMSEVYIISDTIIVSESVSVQVEVPGETNISVSEAISVGESVEVAVEVVGELYTSVSEVITLAESVTVQVESENEYYISVSDSIGISESVALKVGELLIGVVDSAIVTEVSAQVGVGSPLINVIDSITITEGTPQVVIGGIRIVVVDSVTVTETQPTSALSGIEVAVVDSIVVTDTAVVVVGIVLCFVSEAITVTELVSLEGPANIFITETIILAESRGVVITEEGVFNVSINEPVISVTELAELKVGTLLLLVSESISVGESITVPYIRLEVNTSETISVTETISLSFKLEIGVAETVIVSSAISLALARLEVQAQESLSVSEQLAVALGGVLVPVVSDSVTVSESLAVKLGTVLIVATEVISVSENIAAKVGDLAVAVSDSATVSEGVTIGIGLESNYNISVSDSIMLSETVVRIIGTVRLVVSDSITVTATPSATVTEEGVLYISRSQSVTVTESANEIVGTVLALAGESVTIVESVNVQYLLRIAVSDAPAVSEARLLVVGAILITASESIAVGENFLVATEDPKIFVTDVLVVTETPLLVVSALTLSVSETAVVVGESSQASCSAPLIFAAEIVTITESLALYYGCRIAIGESAVTVTEALEIAPGVLLLTALDSVTVAELIFVAVPDFTYLLFVTEIITVTEWLRISIGIVVYLTSTIVPEATLDSTILTEVTLISTVTPTATLDSTIRS